MLLKYNGIVAGKKVKIYSSGDKFGLYVNNVLDGEYESYRDAINSIINKESDNAKEESSRAKESNKKTKGKKTSSRSNRSTSKGSGSKDTSNSDDKGTVPEVAGDGTSDAKKEVTEIL